jgi:phage terminase large subunit
MKEKVVSLKEVVGRGYGDFWRCEKRYRVCKGSRGSKKSKTSALNFIVRMMKHPQANLLVVRKTQATLKDSCYSDLKWAISRLGVEAYWKCTLNPLEIVYVPTGQRILFRGMDDPLKITSISVPVGVLCWVWIEEAYEITKEDDFNKLDMSIRGEVPEGLFKQITLTFNPWSAQSWLKARFFDTPDEDTFTKTTTYQCNEWLDASDLGIFEKMRVNNPRRYRIEGLGEWGIAEGLIYEKVEFRDFDIQALREKAGIKSAFGLDFGFTDPTAFVAMLIDEEDAKIYVFDEFYLRGVTNARIAERIDAMGYAGQRIVCDSAEPKSIQELQDLGIRAEPSRKGRDSVLHGIQKLQNFTWIVSTKCVEFFHEISNYAWEKDKFGKPVDKPEHEFSHCMDAARYAAAKVLVGETFSFD